MLKQLFSIFMLFVLSTTIVFAEEFVAGKDYVVITDTEQPKSTGKSVDVMEFFSYGCPWCYRIEPGLNHWASTQGEKVSYNKVPVVFKKDWEYYAKAFYTAKALDLTSQLSPILFKSILEDKVSLNNDESMIEFFTKHGVEGDIAKSAFQHSPSINIELEGSKRLMAQYQISAVPAVVVNYQYKTDLQMAKSEERLFAILNFLIDKAHQESSKA